MRERKMAERDRTWTKTLEFDFTRMDKSFPSRRCGMKRLHGIGLAVAILLATPVFATTQSGDAQVQASIQNKIYHTRSFNRGQIQVSYDHGVATLTGSVDSLGTKLDAERDARNVKGVEQVVNNLIVETEDVKPV